MARPRRAVLSPCILEDRITPTTFTVTSSADSGAGSLREAILGTNGTAGPDTIIFDASFSSAKTITLGGTQLPTLTDTTGMTTIIGPGANLLTINGNNLSRVLEVAVNVTVLISGVTLSGGKTAGGFGGGILNYGTLMVKNSTLSGNSATDGGGIYNQGTLTVDNSTLSGNSATEGGGIYNVGSMTVNSSTLSGNSAISGGGLWDASQLTVTNSTLSGNIANFGGAISSNGKLTVTNSTLSANTAGISGGAIYSGGTLTVTSSIISGNSAATALDIKSYFDINVNFSAIGASQGFTLSGSSGNNLPFQPFINLKLAPLADNGGPTLTHLPANDSPLINAGSNPQSLTTDQRGSARVSGPQPDMGAVEIAPEAPSLHVTTSTDTVNSSDFKTSLREAIGYANAKSGADAITFDASFNSAATITLGGTQLPTLTDTTGMTTIIGPGANLLTISGNNLSRVLEIAAGATVSISGVTLSAGKAAGASPADRGGGLYNTGTLTVANSILSGNRASFGGGIYSTSLLTVINSTLSGNTAGFNGGGIVNNGTLTVSHSTFNGNATGVNGTGGGITSGYGATATVTNSTISGNFAVFGGGIFHRGTLTVTNSTIIDNNATNNGGGIHNFHPAPGTRTITSSIISGNIAPDGPDLHISSSPANVNFSAIGASQGFTFSGSSGNNLPFQPVANLKLGPLADNGGATLTHLPANDSPLINAGSNPALLTTDQRGLPRVSGVQSDIGAVEVGGPQESPSLIVTASNDIVNVFDFKTSLREAIGYANAKSGADAITFDVSFNSAATITLGGTQLPTLTDTTGMTTIIGPGANLLTISGNNLSRVLEIAAGATVSISGVTLSAGKAAGASPADRGGGLYNTGTLTVANSILSGNRASFGGGIYSTSLLTVINSTLSGNTAGFNGGGIVNNGTLTVSHSTFNGNATGVNGTGGGITSGYGATATVTNSTISGNFAVFGGGIFHRGTLTVTNSTIIDNNATNNGGGIHNFHPAPGTRTITSSIISGNIAPDGPDLHISSSPANVNFSAIGASQGFTFSGSSGNNLPFQPVANLKLGPLADNGGATLTHLPANDSPLINAGSNPALLTTDQRGLPRVSGVQSDIGAVEIPPTVSDLTVNGGADQRSRITGVTVTFSTSLDVTLFQNPGAVTLTRTVGGLGTVVTIGSGLVITPGAGNTNTITLTFQNASLSGVENGSLADGRWQLTIPLLNYQSTLNDPNLRRLYGDANADGTVDATDFGNFGAVFGGTSVAFDFDNNGTVDALDFGEFGNRFGITL